MSSRKLKIALAGNPNSGKTSIFNALTGARQKVANYPGVTVEKRIGLAQCNGYELEIVDLPGTYSLSAASTDERVARDFLLEYQPDVIVNVIDAGNLERNLYLTTQLLELEADLVIDLNMWDEAERMGSKIDAAKLAQLLGAPVVTSVGHKGQGADRIARACISLAEGSAEGHRHVPVTYGAQVEASVVDLTRRLQGCTKCAGCPSRRWLAVRMLEGDREAESRYVKSREEVESLGRQLRKQVRQIRSSTGHEPELILTERRYAFISGILREVLSDRPTDRMALSRRIDGILTHKILGYPIFIMLLWLIFQATYALGSYPMAWISAGVSYLSAFLTDVLPPGLLADLLVGGVVAGTGAVLVFLPNILILFAGIAILEDSGYMARAAFLMDRLMHLLGLHGKSFIPMLMGFGCNVPAIMAARTLESERDRKMTILLVPLMSCSARLPVYVLVAGTFFGAQAGNLIFAMYWLGVLVAVATARLLTKTLFRQKVAPFVMELPPYRRPTLSGVLIQMSERALVYLRKIGGVILVVSVALWFLGHFPQRTDYTRDYRAEAAALQQHLGDPSIPSGQRLALTEELRAIGAARQKEGLEYSLLGRVGRWLEPAVRPLGFDWRFGIALVSGFIAKEVIISTLGVIYQVGQDTGDRIAGLTKALRDPASGIGPRAALAFMVFVLLYTPCVGTLLAIRNEAGVGLMLFSVLYQSALAWLFALLVFRLGGLFGLA